MKKSLRIALAVVLLASAAPIVVAGPINPAPVPMPHLAMAGPINPAPVPMPHLAMAGPINPAPVPMPHAYLAQ